MRITTQSELEKFISQQGLVDNNSIKTCQDVAQPTSIYFGVGLVNAQGRLTQGIPLDILSMILVGEAVSENKKILIADTHAQKTINRSVDEISSEIATAIRSTIENLGFTGWEVIKASEIDQIDTYQSILNSLQIDNEYVRRQLADMEWFRRQGVNLKVGWRLNGIRDETWFDRQFVEVFGNELSFLYVKPGRTLNISKPRAPPYLCENPFERITIEPDQGLIWKMENSSFQNNGARKYFRNLLLLYNRVTGERLDEKNVNQGVRKLLDRCLQ